MTWPEFRAFVNHLDATSAVYRRMNPKSWWWTPELDFLSAILLSVQMGNWQRGGGKGSRPQPITRPKEAPKRAKKDIQDPKSGDELAARKKRMRSELAERRKVVS